MSTIPYFLRNPNLDDQAQQPMTMAPAAAPQGMAAQVVQHPMHAMIAPIVGAPLRMSTMRPAEDPGQEPAAMSQGNISSVGGDQMSAPVQAIPSAIEPKQPTVRTMSPIERREDQLQQGMAQKPEGFWGNLKHYAGMAAPTNSAMQKCADWKKSRASRLCRVRKQAINRQRQTCTIRKRKPLSLLKSVLKKRGRWAIQRLPASRLRRASTSTF